MKLIEEEKMLKKVKENFKKKRRHWKIDYATEININDAYDAALASLFIH